MQVQLMAALHVNLREMEHKNEEYKLQVSPPFMGFMGAAAGPCVNPSSLKCRQ